MKWPKVGIGCIDEDGDESEAFVNQSDEFVCLEVGGSLFYFNPSDANLLAEALGAYADDCNPQGENA